LTDWVDRLLLPNWAFYLSLWLLLFATETLIHSSDGSYPPGVVYPFHLVLTGRFPYFLALIHYLDKCAESALLSFDRRQTSPSRNSPTCAINSPHCRGVG
jgi:hypothetical protein